MCDMCAGRHARVHVCMCVHLLMCACVLVCVCAYGYMHEGCMCVCVCFCVHTRVHACAYAAAGAGEKGEHFLPSTGVASAGSCPLLPAPQDIVSREHPVGADTEKKKEEPVSWPRCNSPAQGSATLVHLVLGHLCAGLMPSLAENFCTPQVQAEVWVSRAACRVNESPLRDHILLSLQPHPQVPLTP